MGNSIAMLTEVMTVGDSGSCNFKVSACTSGSVFIASNARLMASGLSYSSENKVELTCSPATVERNSRTSPPWRPTTLAASLDMLTACAIWPSFTCPITDCETRIAMVLSVRRDPPLDPTTLCAHRVHNVDQGGATAVARLRRLQLNVVN